MKQALRAHRYLVGLVVFAAIAAGVGVKETSHSVPTGSATVQLLIDSPQSALADLKQETLPLVARSQVFAQLMTSGAVLNSIAKTAGVPAADVTAEGPYSGAGQGLDVPTPSEARGPQIVATTALYHLVFVADANIPLVTASVEGPSPAAAGKLANAIYPGVEAWLKQLQESGAIPPSTRVTIRQLGEAQAGTVNSSSATMLAGLVGAAVLLIGLLAIVALESTKRNATDSVGQSEPVKQEGVARTHLAVSKGTPPIELDPTDDVLRPDEDLAVPAARRDGTGASPAVPNGLRRLDHTLDAAMGGARRLPDTTPVGSRSAGRSESARSDRPTGDF